MALWGGRMVCGWSFRIDPLEGFTNCMADIEARPHAVWADEDGQLWEVSPDCRGAYFLPSDMVRPNLKRLQRQLHRQRASGPHLSPVRPVPGGSVARSENFYACCRRQGG